MRASMGLNQPTIPWKDHQQGLLELTSSSASTCIPPHSLQPRWFSVLCHRYMLDKLLAMLCFSLTSFQGLNMPFTPTSYGFGGLPCM